MCEDNRNFIGCLLITACSYILALFVVTATAHSEPVGKGGADWSVYSPFEHPYIAIALVTLVGLTWGVMIVNDCFFWPCWKREEKIRLPKAQVKKR